MIIEVRAHAGNNYLALMAAMGLSDILRVYDDDAVVEYNADGHMKTWRAGPSTTTEGYTYGVEEDNQPNYPEWPGKYRAFVDFKHRRLWTGEAHQTSDGLMNEARVACNRIIEADRLP